MWLSLGGGSNYLFSPPEQMTAVKEYMEEEYAPLW